MHVNTPILTSPSPCVFQLIAGGAGKYITFRLTSNKEYGCANDDCGAGCPINRYRFARQTQNSKKLQLLVTIAP